MGLCRSAYNTADQTERMKRVEKRMSVSANATVGIAGGMARRCSQMLPAMNLSVSALDEVADDADDPPVLLPRTKSGGIPPKMARGRSFILQAEDDSKENISDFLNRFVAKGDAPHGGLGAAAGTGASAADVEQDASSLGGDAADTGGAPSCGRAGPHPLKDIMTTKKPDVDKLKELLLSMPDRQLWIESVLDRGPPMVPTPLVYAVGTTHAGMVALLLEYQADVRKPYGGESMFNGWVKPGALLPDSVTSRKGRFMGTMLGDRLENILQLLMAADAKVGCATDAEGQLAVAAKVKEVSAKQKSEKYGASGGRKSIKLDALGLGVIEHSQASPHERYENLSVIEEGGFCVVSKARHRKSGVMRAMKVELKAEEAGLWEEIGIMRKVSHANVIQLYETFEDETQIYMILDLCAGGELFDRLANEGGIPEGHASRLMMQLASAVQHLHERKICHRDIQPENFLLCDTSPLDQVCVKLIDFTTAKEFGPEEEPMKTKVCTLHYVAPEILTRKDIPYTEKVDVWSLGVVFFVMLCGSPPFHADTEVAVLKGIKKGLYTFSPDDVWDNISLEAKDLVRKMLVVNADIRFSAHQVVAHPWLSAEFQAAAASTQSVSMDSGRIQHLRNFHARNRVDKVVLQMSSMQLTDDSIKDLRKIFKRLDTSGDGMVSIGAVRDKVKAVPSLNQNIEDIMKVLWNLERGTGKVNFNAFLEETVKRHRALQKDACRAIFSVFDFDGSGAISQQELRDAMNSRDGKSAFDKGIQSAFGIDAKDIFKVFGLENELDPAEDDREYNFDQFYEILQTAGGLGLANQPAAAG